MTCGFGDKAVCQRRRSAYTHTTGITPSSGTRTIPLACLQGKL